jgi:signal transduction histidine kinase
MAKIPFKVSARTARLIGGQNFSNAEGAVIELVKNCYDADAKKCIVFFDNRYASIPKTLSREEYQTFKDVALVRDSFNVNDKAAGYVLDLGDSKPLSLDETERNAELERIENTRVQLHKFFIEQTKLFIIDDGEGMTDEIIRDHWMVIGTNNKEEDIYTEKGRVKTGAKGIGRFALDRLGTKAEMITKPSLDRYPKADSKTGYVWDVDWDDFDGAGSEVIGDIKANLIDVKPTNIGLEVEKIVPKALLAKARVNLADYQNGTIIQISGLKEAWDTFYVDKVYSSLEVLIPPSEGRKFEVFVFTTASPDSYGRVEPSLCEDFDYKLTAHVEKDGAAKITILRNEYNLNKISPQFFSRPKLQEDRFAKKYFGKEPLVYFRTLSQLLPGFKEKDENKILESIGPFDFAFYFMKGRTAKKDMERFCYKDFDEAARKTWLDEFGGIKIFRDGFRVRPYGEKGNASDWLDLGSRAASSPAGIGKKGGGYKVRPNNVAGAINISRVTNLQLDDKSNREGLQENETFWVFRQIITKLIEEFENDRSQIGYELAAFYEETNRAQITEEQAADILARIKQTAKSKRPDEAKSEDERDKEILAQLVSIKEEEIDELKNEQQLLKILASNALTIASFTHELRNIEKNLVNRVDEAEKQFKAVFDPKHCDNLPDYLNPFTMLQDIKHDDVKLKEWLGYSLGSLRKDKRRRRNVDLIKYFHDFELTWKNAFDNRGIKFRAKLPLVSPLNIRVFEIDLDCIFNNLVTNTFEAFIRKDAPMEREITIRLQISDSDVIFTYQDSGPGLSKDILEPNRIFEPHFTTKRDLHTGEETGTGLGMWLVKSFVEDNKGTVELLSANKGFGLKILLPNKLRGKNV